MENHCIGYAMVEVFLLHCEQWCDIHLSSAPAKNHLPNLQKLHLNLRLEETIDIFEFAPQLRWLRLTPSIGPSLPNVPWNQIKDLTMGARRIDQWYCVRHRISRNAQYSLLTRNNIIHILRFNSFASIT
jgi:hypothetical protein